MQLEFAEGWPVGAQAAITIAVPCIMVYSTLVAPCAVLKGVVNKVVAAAQVLVDLNGLVQLDGGSPPRNRPQAVSPSQADLPS